MRFRFHLLAVIITASVALSVSQFVSSAQKQTPEKLDLLILHGFGLGVVAMRTFLDAGLLQFDVRGLAAARLGERDQHVARAVSLAGRTGRVHDVEVVLHAVAEAHDLAGGEATRRDESVAVDVRTDDTKTGEQRHGTGFVHEVV